MLFHHISDKVTTAIVFFGLAIGSHLEERGGNNTQFHTDWPLIRGPSPLEKKGQPWSCLCESRQKSNARRHGDNGRAVFGFRSLASPTSFGIRWQLVGQSWRGEGGLIARACNTCYLPFTTHILVFIVMSQLLLAPVSFQDCCIFFSCLDAENLSLLFSFQR